MSIAMFLAESGHHSQVLLTKPPIEAGLLVVCARQGRRVFAFHADVLAAFGARHDVRSAHGRLGAAKDLDLIEAWAHSHRLSGLLVAHAEWCDPRWYGELHDRLDRAGTQLGLIADDGCGDQLADWVEQHGGVIADDDALDHFIATHTRPTIPAAEDTADDYPQMLPLVDFYLWRSRCRDILNAPDFAKVDAQYCATYRYVRQNLPQAPEEASQLLVDLIARTTNLGRAVTMLRAMQAATFHSGWSLQLRMPAFRTTIAEQEHRRLTPSELRAMRAYAQPWIAVATVLKDAGIDARTISKLTLSTVGDDGSLTYRNGRDRDLPLESRVFMRAQRRIRELEGAQTGDPLLTQNQRDIQAAQRSVPRDLNLHLVARTPKVNESDWVGYLRLQYRPLKGATE